MIAGHETFLLAQSGGENSFVSIISAVSKKLERQEWMRRSAFAQIYLDRIRLPISVRFTDAHKVDGKTAHHSFTSQTRALKS